MTFAARSELPEIPRQASELLARAITWPFLTSRGARMDSALRALS